jgi:hypothetical protein
MAKNANTAGSGVIRVTLSEQSVRLLDELAEKGIYGRNKAEVAGRFIDEALQKFVEVPRLNLEGNTRRKRT